MSSVHERSFTMSRRAILTVVSLLSFAAVVTAGASASSGSRTSKSVAQAVDVEVVSPRPADVAGRQSKGFFVDLALRYPSFGASGADFQLTGPTTHQNQAPFPGLF